MNKPIIAYVVAMAKNRVIGVNGRIPWHLPDDMKWFRDVTMGKPVIMGRKTYESIPARYRPLSGRHNIVVTHQSDYDAPGATVVHTVDDAVAAAGHVDEMIIGGGAVLYEALWSCAQRLYLTQIEGDFAGDVFFPIDDLSDWYETFRQLHEPDAHHLYRFSWLILERR